MTRLNVLLCLLLFGFSCLSFIIETDHYVNKNNISSWSNYSSDPGKWCENPRKTGFILEPINAYSNISYLIVSLLLFYESYKIFNHPIKYNLLFNLKYLGFYYVIINFFHFIGSFINHSCRCNFGHRLDNIGTYNIIIFWMVYYLARYKFYSNKNI